MKDFTITFRVDSDAINKLKLLSDKNRISLCAQARQILMCQLEKLNK